MAECPETYTPHPSPASSSRRNRAESRARTLFLFQYCTDRGPKILHVGDGFWRTTTIASPGECRSYNEGACLPVRVHVALPPSRPQIDVPWPSDTSGTIPKFFAVGTHHLGGNKNSACSTESCNCRNSLLVGYSGGSTTASNRALGSESSSLGTRSDWLWPFLKMDTLVPLGRQQAVCRKGRTSVPAAMR